jgi:predicted RNase H-like HicB family nuclease
MATRKLASSSYASLININVEYDRQGHWVLSSKDLPGLLLSGKQLDALFNDVPNAIKLLYKLNYQMDVTVNPIIPPQP